MRVELGVPFMLKKTDRNPGVQPSTVDNAALSAQVSLGIPSLMKDMQRVRHLFFFRNRHMHITVAELTNYVSPIERWRRKE